MNKTTLKDRLMKGQLWWNLLLSAGAILYPTANEYLNANPEMALAMLGALNMIFGFFSKKDAKLIE